MSVLKRDAFDASLLSRHPNPAERLTPSSGEEQVCSTGPEWLADVDPRRQPTFAGWRDRPGDPVGPVRYHLVLDVDVAGDRLVLLPLDRRLSPLDVLDPDRPERDGRALAAWRSWRASPNAAPPADSISVPLREAIDGARLGPPIPPPRTVLAVAANFPSHLRADLAVSGVNARREILHRGHVRVFRKHPATTSPDGSAPDLPAGGGIVGPFDGLRCPAAVRLPPGPRGTGARSVAPAFDYEVELGVVIGRRLGAEEVRALDDDGLRDAIAGTLLVSDAKVRNPQAFLNIVHRDGPPPDAVAAYRSGDRELDRALGSWGRTTCQWWSHAASCGAFTAMGPFFVAGGAPPPEAHVGLVAARSYAPPGVRGARVPAGREPGPLYLRQCGSCTEDRGHGDHLIWSLPEVIRSLFAADSVVGFGDGEAALVPGDVLLLGTPGGVAITAIDPRLAAFARRLLFLRNADGWHDAFFRRHAARYLLPGDRVMLWAEGLGYQLHEVSIGGT